MSPSSVLFSSRDSFRFNLFDVDPALELLKSHSTRESVETLIGFPIEACSGYAEVNCCVDVTTNPLVTAVALAYSQHRPLCLTPDAVWTTILQGLSTHIEEKWEELHSRVVTSGLTQRFVGVSTEAFPFGSPESPWEELVEEATSTAYGAVHENVAEMFDVSFSTTTTRDRAAMDLAFLAAVRSYIGLHDLKSVCGIPSLTITGRREDWSSMRCLVDKLDAFDLDWWTKFLRPILDEFVLASDGSPNLGFWKQIYSTSQVTCGTQERITGWITHLFPYLPTINHELARNPNFVGEEPPNLDSIPNGIREVPLQSRDGTSVNLMGGFLGIAQESDGMLTPKLGWAVRRPDSFEALLNECARHPATSCVERNGKQRIDLGGIDKKLERFATRFSSVRFTADGRVICEFSDTVTMKIATESAPLHIVARLDDGRWIGAVKLATQTAMRTMLRTGAAPKTAFFIGDNSTLTSGGLADIITTDFEQLLSQLLKCLDNSEPLTLVPVARLDPSDRVAIEQAIVLK